MGARLGAAAMWFYRRMFRISYKEHVSNIEVLSRASSERIILKTIRKRQLEFLGHVMRKEGF